MNTAEAVDLVERLRSLGYRGKSLAHADHRPGVSLPNASRAAFYITEAEREYLLRRVELDLGERVDA